MTRSEEILQKNARYIPGGMSSLNRRTTPPICFAKAHGCRLWDADGREYIDYHAGFAPYILGHNDPDVNLAIAEAMEQGFSNFGSGGTEQEGRLAELFLNCVVYAEQVQFFNTGSEATAQAIRVARAATGRTHIVLMQGGYNGHHNSVAVNLMSSIEQLGGKRIVGDEYPVVPITAGIPPNELAKLHVVDFNDLDAVETIARRYRIACLLTEPVLQNIGVVKPQPGYLQGLRELADRYGFLLIFDEVKTGFRASLGGYQMTAQVVPDLSTFGKALGNGMPIAALAGKAEWMELSSCDDSTKRVLVAGTYNAHPLPVAAAIACLKKLCDPNRDAYGKLEALSQRLEQGQVRLFARYGINAVVNRVGSAHCIYFTSQAPSSWWDIVSRHDFARDIAYRQALINRGIFNFPVPVKQGSISLAHNEEDIDQTLAAIASVLAENETHPLF